MSILVSHETKITDISTHIKTARDGKVSKQKFPIDLLEEFRALDAQLETLQCRIGVVFLTGASGYLGVQILRQLLVHTGVDRVITHVRAQSSDDALQRLRDSANYAGWSVSRSNPKLEVWAGDLSQPRLGVTLDQWARLQKADAIIHNGASVNWTRGYRALKATNVNSTFEILKFMSHAEPQPKLVYVTGGRIYDESEDPESKFATLSSRDGYSQTKILSEVLVKTFAQREAKLGRSPHVSILEPGFIMGTADEGVTSTSDFVWRYVAGAVSIGMYPEPEEGDWLEVSSSDRVASATISGLLKTGVEPGFKIRMADGITMHEFWRVIIAHTGRDLRPVSSVEWQKRIQVEIDRDTEAHTLWPVLKHSCMIQEMMKSVVFELF